MTDERKLVITGECLGKGRAGFGTYQEGEMVYSKYIGLAEERNNTWNVIQLTGIYNPKRGDGIIGKIEDVIFSKWIIDINSPYQAVLPLSEATEEYIDATKDLTSYFDYNDLIFAEISSLTKTKNIQLSMRNRKCRKLKGGRIIRVVPSKVPRIIGKAGSMVEMIKEMTGTQIVVGQNGLVWVKGENEDIAAEAILLVEARSHTTGLTNYIKDTLEKKALVIKKESKKEPEDYTEINSNDAYSEPIR